MSFQLVGKLHNTCREHISFEVAAITDSQHLVLLSLSSESSVDLLHLLHSEFSVGFG